MFGDRRRESSDAFRIASQLYISSQRHAMRPQRIACSAVVQRYNSARDISAAVVALLADSEL